MKTCRALLIFVFTLLCAACSQTPDYEGYTGRFVAFIQNGDEAGVKRLHEEIDREIARHPGDWRLVQIRLSVNQHMGDKDAIEADIHLLADLQPESPFHQFNKCYAQEVRQGYSPSTVQCYSQVLRLYEKHAPPEELRLNWNYVITALLAESPNAPTLRDDFLREAADGPFARHEKQALRHFNRKDFIEGNWPAIDPENMPPPSHVR